MAFAQEMKTLAGNLRASHRTRSAFISGMKKDTRDFLMSADDSMKQIAKEIRATAAELKDFLADSEENRKGNSSRLRKEIQASIKAIQARIGKISKDAQDFLSTAGEDRRAAFKEAMEEIASRVSALAHDTQKTLREYAAERKEGHAAWAGVSSGGAQEGSEAASPRKRRGRPKKQG